MKFELARETLLKPLQQVIGAVERRQTMPALGNVLLSAGEHGLQVTATDLEVELRATIELEPEQPGETTVSARKLLDICRNLPQGASLRIELDGERMQVRSGRSRFTLATLPSGEFPVVDELDSPVEVALPQADLRRAIEKIGFAMAQQDVRYYLNGMLLELENNRLRSVATDGHRLSLCEIDAELPEVEQQVIVPRKGINELVRLLDPESDEPARVRLGSTHIQVTLPGLRFTSKLIDGRFPDYGRVVPQEGSNVLEADRETLRQSLARISILSNEKFKGVRLVMSDDALKVQTNNPEQEEAEEEVEVGYKGDPLEIGFNVVYLLDILASLDSDAVRIEFGDSNSSCLVTESGSSQCRHVVMPMRL
ncbi:MAG: DNA polymerase III subunit beta [Halofilum sp. (in: g-proteobacteria)]|nr:DNA polymerase III subunit beta [Halofilum sp. (in: g-proteobacteria)]